MHPTNGHCNTCRARRRSGGFSLIETLVAVTILLIAILAPMRIVSQSVKASALASEQLAATLLAQEGIEAIIAIRDNDALDGGNTWEWFDNPGGTGHLISACKNAAVGCSYNAFDGELVACGGDACRLYLDDSGDEAFYTHESGRGIESPYSRTVVVSEEVSGEVTILSTVTWYSGAVQDNISVELETNIFDQHAE